MTPEQKQQLDQVIKRHNQQPPSTSTMTCWNDIDFLLSLVKSQEVQINATSNEIRNSEQYQSLLLNMPDVATSMRSACVKKVKDWLGKAGFDHGPLVREMESLTPSGARNDKA